MTGQEYMNAIYAALGDKLLNPDSIYSTRDGHLRLAHECGYALADFETEKERDDVLNCSYSVIYVRACMLKPILSAKEWHNEMVYGYAKAYEYRHGQFPPDIVGGMLKRVADRIEREQICST